MRVGTLGHALLGLLADHPRTGYALLKHFEQSLGYAWPASHSQIYPELAKLREAGLIREGASLPRGGRP
jgi:PadR family transcriptional regulator AphA